MSRVPSKRPPLTPHDWRMLMRMKIYADLGASIGNKDLWMTTQDVGHLDGKPGYTTLMKLASRQLVRFKKAHRTCRWRISAAGRAALEGREKT